jgi:hypothetical protein
MKVTEEMRQQAQVLLKNACELVRLAKEANPEQESDHVYMTHCNGSGLVFMDGDREVGGRRQVIFDINGNADEHFIGGW